MKKLKSIIRHPEFRPEDYGGIFGGDYQFQRFFYLGEKTPEETFDEVNSFLVDNGYDALDFFSFWKEKEVENNGVVLSADPFVNDLTKRLILTITIFNPWDNPVDRVIVELIKFRNERDWGQFHNSKDLALALNVEASELLELFLWKGNEEAKPEKLKEELADVFLYGLLLLEKHGWDFEEILMDKIRVNDLKYPASKAKGSSKKYNEL